MQVFAKQLRLFDKINFVKSFHIVFFIAIVLTYENQVHRESIFTAI